MKLCVITNYQNKGYINEIITFNKIINSLSIPHNDVYNFNSPNIIYEINKTYTHALIFLDYNDVFKDFSNRFLNKCIKRGMSHNDFVPEVLHSVLIACVNQAFVKESSFLETTFVTDKEFLF